jgi:nucleoside-diphosphate-sugar epimerase
MKVLITGDQGFIGSNLTTYLKKLDYVVEGIDLKSNQNILNCKLPTCDLVIHLAGMSGVRESIENPQKYWINNVEGTVRVLNHYANTRVLVASSSSQYEPYLNPYAASKHIIESIPHTNVCFMRLHTVYGPTPRKGMFFDKLLTGTLEYVTNHTRDFIHIDDVCNAMCLLMNSTITGPIDVGTGVAVSIRDISPDLPLTDGSPSERQHTLADIAKLASLGFIPKHTVNTFLENYNTIGLSTADTAGGHP